MADDLSWYLTSWPTAPYPIISLAAVIDRSMSRILLNGSLRQMWYTTHLWLAVESHWRRPLSATVLVINCCFAPLNAITKLTTIDRPAAQFCRLEKFYFILPAKSTELVDNGGTTEVMNSKKVVYSTISAVVDLNWQCWFCLCSLLCHQ